MFGYHSNSSIFFNPTTSKYSVNFGGKSIETTVTDKAAVAKEWVEKILSIYGGHPMVVGLDIEWKPVYSKWTTNKSATLQLCIDDKCLIVQLFYLDYIPQSLRSFLIHSNFTFVGVEVGDDVTKLSNDYGIVCNKIADIRELSKCKWPGRFSRPGLKDLAFEVAGLRMMKPKHVTMSNWEARVLSEKQVEYGCIDAYVSFRVGYMLLIEN